MACIGAAEHANTIILVTVSPDGHLLDRRTIELTTGLSTHPYHHEGSWAVGRYANSPWSRQMSLADAVALIDRVQEAAMQGAREGLEALATSVHVPITSIAIRACPDLPATTEARITDTQSSNVADSVMYRQALASAARERGWTVHWYDRDRVPHDEAVLRAMGRAVGPPWQAKHKLAAAAALSSRRP